MYFRIGYAAPHFTLHLVAHPLLIGSLYCVSHMGITAVNPERGDVDRIIDVLREVISEATSKRRTAL